MAHPHLVCLLASGPCGWLYIGVSNGLIRRVDEHKHRQIPGYTAEHVIDQLVWCETHRYIDQAILGEKEIKRRRREWEVRPGGGSQPLVARPLSQPVWRNCARLGPGGPSGRVGGVGRSRPGSPLRGVRDDKDGESGSPLRSVRDDKDGERYSRPGQQRGEGQSASIFRAAMKASWGISTLPNWRMRFLPSFCFSSSFFLRVASPP